MKEVNVEKVFRTIAMILSMRDERQKVTLVKVEKKAAKAS